jgi:hypothetical protein
MLASHLSLIKKWFVCDLLFEQQKISTELRISSCQRASEIERKQAETARREKEADTKEHKTFWSQSLIKSIRIWQIIFFIVPFPLTSPLCASIVA